MTATYFRYGQTFMYKNALYMRINTVENVDPPYICKQRYNAVCLNDGKLYYFNDDKEVTLVDCIIQPIERNCYK